MTPLQIALEHANELVQLGNWVRIESYPPMTPYLTYGRIHTDGTKENAIATRTYYEFNNRVRYNTTVHP